MTSHSEPSPDVDDLAPEQLVVAAILRVNLGCSKAEALATVRDNRFAAYAAGARVLPVLTSVGQGWADVVAKWEALR